MDNKPFTTIDDLSAPASRPQTQQLVQPQQPMRVQDVTENEPPKSILESKKLAIIIGIIGFIIIGVVFYFLFHSAGVI